MNQLLTLFVLIICVISLQFCKQKTDTSTQVDKFNDSLETARKVDSMVKETVRNAMFDTAGLSAAPVRVLKARLVKREYSSYRDIELTYQNVSSKRIEAMRFKWYGINAFKEPADMGAMSSFSAGFGSGQDDRPLNPGRKTSGQWQILSTDAKKIVLAWPYEVVFSDGSKWQTEKN